MNEPLYVNNICIGLLNKCNWNCTYCIAKRVGQIVDEDNIIEQIIPIKHKLRNLVLSGGEPGLLSIDFWDKLFSLTDYKLGICTNGTFVINGLAHRYKSKIKTLIIHCVQELDQDIHPVTLDFIRNPFVPIVVNVVIHNKNSHLISDFLDKYNDISFSINFTDSTFIKDDSYDYAINKESAIKIVNQLSKYKGYSTEMSKLIRCIINNNFTYINYWSPDNKELG